MSTPAEDLPDHLVDSRLRAPILRLIFLLHCAVGLGASIHLTQLHVKAHTRPDATSYCSVHAKVDCLSVAESPWAVLWGVPVSVWSILAYSVLFLGGVWIFVAQFRQQSRRRRGEPEAPEGARPRTYHTMPGVMFVAGVVAVLGALVMAYISHFWVKSLCVVCAVLYLVNIVLLVTGWLTCRKHGGIVASVRRDYELYRGNVMNLMGAGSLMLVIGGGLMAFYPTYWVLNEPVGPGKLPHGITADGHPWIGAKDPVLTIYEFSDYQCAFCRGFNAKLRKILNKPKFRDKVRLIHYHYPLDNKCNPTVTRKFHPRACELARAAVCAQEQGKFWHMNDMMFRRQRRRGGPNLTGLAGKLNLNISKFNDCLGSARAKKKVAGDMAAGERMARQISGEGIPGTPYYVFHRKGEEPRRGHIYEKVIARALTRIVHAHGPEGVDHGLTADGHPWIGAKHPRLVIYELSDYECYHCKRRHALLRQLLKTKKDLQQDVRLVHLQYPLGHQCNPTVKTPLHKRACVMARAALCGKEQGKFWEMNDALYRLYRKRRPPNMATVARAAGLNMRWFAKCLNTHEKQLAVRREVFYGEKLGQVDGKGVPAAPTYFFKPAGLPLGRAMPPTEKSIRAALKKAGPRPAPKEDTMRPAPMEPAPDMKPE